MGDVVDYFSRRKVSPQELYDNNSRVAETGKYIGVLPKHDAEAMRDAIEQLRLKRMQAEAMAQEFSAMWDGYGFMLLRAMVTLGANIEQFNPDTQDVYVDKDGHCWIVSSTE